jgi:hypothetical protein
MISPTTVIRLRRAVCYASSPASKMFTTFDAFWYKRSAHSDIIQISHDASLGAAARIRPQGFASSHQKAP